jgi:hypothetical protein
MTSVAYRVWVPWPVSELVKVIGPQVPAESAAAFEFTVNVTVVPADVVPEVTEGVSQLGTPETE